MVGEYFEGVHHGLELLAVSHGEGLEDGADWEVLAELGDELPHGVGVAEVPLARGEFLVGDLDWDKGQRRLTDLGGLPGAGVGLVVEVAEVGLASGQLEHGVELVVLLLELDDLLVGLVEGAHEVLLLLVALEHLEEVLERHVGLLLLHLLHELLGADHRPTHK